MLFASQFELVKYKYIYLYVPKWRYSTAQIGKSGSLRSAEVLLLFLNVKAQLKNCLHHTESYSIKCKGRDEMSYTLTAFLSSQYMEVHRWTLKHETIYIKI